MNFDNIMDFVASHRQHPRGMLEHVIKNHNGFPGFFWISLNYRRSMNNDLILSFQINLIFIVIF